MTLAQPPAMTEPVTLSDEDLAVLEHALGIDQRQTPYRKHFTAALDTSWHDQCDRLTALGFMTRFGEPDRVGQTFHVTPAGAGALGVRLP